MIFFLAMDFQQVVEVYSQLEKTASGNAMREILADFFKSVPKEDIAKVAYLTLGQIASEYEGEVLGMAEKSVLAVTTARQLIQAEAHRLINLSRASFLPDLY